MMNNFTFINLFNFVILHCALHGEAIIFGISFTLKYFYEQYP